MLFIGLDLAWSPRNRSGGAMLREAHLVTYTGELTSNAAILEWVTSHLRPVESSVLAIDAPLRVPNQRGSRLCDQQLSAEWRRYEAGALPANRRLLAYDGQVRGEVLVDLLHQTLGFGETAPLPQQTAGRFLCEIFPHPAHVSLFQLNKTLKYKAKPRRTLADRLAEFARYQQYLLALRTATPALQGTDELLQRPLTGLRGRRLKAYEDILDAVTCAYTAAYLWHHGPQCTRVYGSLAEGHILTPPLPSS
ncbi:MAG: DUF429 domain-containing protein [Caldilineaceae bacterium]